MCTCLRINMTGRRNCPPLAAISPNQTAIDSLTSTEADVGPQLLIIHVPRLIHTLTPLVLIPPSYTSHFPHFHTPFLHLCPPHTPGTRRYQSSQSLRTLGPPQVLTSSTPDSTLRFHPPHLIPGSTCIHPLIMRLCLQIPDPDSRHLDSPAQRPV